MIHAGAPPSTGDAGEMSAPATLDDCCETLARGEPSRDGECRVAHPTLAAGRRNGQPALGPAQRAHEGFGEAALLHRILRVHPAGKILPAHPLGLGGLPCCPAVESSRAPQPSVPAGRSDRHPVLPVSMDTARFRPGDCLPDRRGRQGASISSFMYGMTFWTMRRSTSQCNKPLRLARRARPAMDP